MSVVIGIACEDKGHFSAVSHIIDDMLVASHGWLDGVLEHCRSWRGLVDGEPWYKYDPDDANDLRPSTINGRRIAPQGRILGEPLKPEAGMWRKILLLFCHSEPRPQVVILVRDVDGFSRERGKGDRRGGVQQVRDGFDWPFEVVIALAEPEVEAWLVSGFVPTGSLEKERLNAVRRALSFDPTTESHRLTSHPNDARTDSKRVLEQLCGTDEERRQACLSDHAMLRERGAMNGLAIFLDEVEQRVVPTFGGLDKMQL